MDNSTVETILILGMLIGLLVMVSIGPSSLRGNPTTHKRKNDGTVIDDDILIDDRLDTKALKKIQVNLHITYRGKGTTQLQNDEMWWDDEELGQPDGNGEPK